MLDKWIKNKKQIGLICGLIMIIISVRFDLFKYPQKEPFATMVVFILFIIVWFPFCFKEKNK